MQWIPQIGMMDAREPFQRFSANIRQRDGSYQVVEIDSLTKMRRIERETEQAARNGEGEALRFRMWNNDASNGDANTFGPDPGVAPSAAAKHRFGLQHGTKPISDPDSVVLGDGVTDANVSALAE